MKHIAIGENHLYSKTYAKGQKFVGKHVIVYVLRDFKAKKLMLAHPQKKYVNRVGLTVSKKIGKSIWQRSFHDHIIRNKNDYEKISKYIYENPIKWQYDRFYTVE